MHSIRTSTHVKEDLSSVTDLLISKYSIIKHLEISDSIFSLDASSIYKDQLMLIKSSKLESGCVPLYVCSCCADLGCSCISVKVEFRKDQYIWSEFAYENDWEEGRVQSKYMKGFGPFVFEKTEYQNLVQSFS